MYDENIIYVQVLLLDNKIEAWKICQSEKHSKYDFKAYWKMDRLNDYTMNTKIFRKEDVDVPKGWTFNSYVYNVSGVRFINQYEYADDYKGIKAKENTLNEYNKERIKLQKMLGNKFDIIGQLGAN